MFGEGNDRLRRTSLVSEPDRALLFLRLKEGSKLLQKLDTALNDHINDYSKVDERTV